MLRAQRVDAVGPRPLKRDVRRRNTMRAVFILALSAPCAFAQLAPNAPTDQPQALDQRQLSETERAIAPYVRTARDTYPAARAKFLAGLPSGQTSFVVTRITDPYGHFEEVFVRVRTIEDGAITGIISSQIALVKGFTAGQSYTFKEADLIDWVITKPDGSEEGNVVGKFLDTYKP